MFRTGSMLLPFQNTLQHTINNVFFAGFHIGVISETKNRQQQIPHKKETQQSHVCGKVLFQVF
jgi:hypothetical protein